MKRRFWSFCFAAALASMGALLAITTHSSSQARLWDDYHALEAHKLRVQSEADLQIADSEVRPFLDPSFVVLAGQRAQEKLQQASEHESLRKRFKR